jgi:hypothetical protein
VAIYVPPSRRRRHLVALVALGLLVGLLAGFAIGRATSSGVDDALATVRGQASDAAIALQRIPIEYSQAVTGSGGESTRTITEAIARARDELDRAWADAPWFGPAARRPVDATLSALDRAVAAHVSLEEFQADVDTAVRAVEDAFGVSISPSS